MKKRVKDFFEKGHYTAILKMVLYEKQLLIIIAFSGRVACC